MTTDEQVVATDEPSKVQAIVLALDELSVGDLRSDLESLEELIDLVDRLKPFIDA